MIIKSITIENFQSYYGIQTLEFANGLNLVIGNGGKGKSKLFNAFYWVLFGKIYITEIGWQKTDGLPHNAKFSLDRHGFINKRAIYEASVGSDVKTSVILELEDDKSCLYQIERTVYANRLECDEWDSSKAWDVRNNILKVSYDTPNGTVVKNDILAESVVDTLFPEGIRNYIWFQGESLDDLINFRDKETLKAAVKHISYFPYYEKLSAIISLSASKIEKSEMKAITAANKQDMGIRALVSSKECLQLNIEKELENKKKIEDNISSIKVALASDEQRMTGLASFNSLVSRYNKCESEINQLGLEISNIDKFQREKLPNLWVLRGIDSMIQECKRIIEEHKEEENAIPERKYLDNPSRAKLEEILRDGKCFVCGSDTTEGTSARQYILDRIKAQEEYLREFEEYSINMKFNKQFNMFVGKIQDYPDSLLLSLSTIDKQYNESEERCEKLLAARKKKTNEFRNIDQEIEEAKKKYGVDPVRQADSAGQVNNSIRASRSYLEREDRKLRISNESLAKYNAQLRDVERDLSKIESKGIVQTVPETEWKHISRFLEDICKKVQENARKDLLRKIEERANKFYNKFTEHDNGYKGSVVIGDDYSIDYDAALNTSHENRKKMSIINALLSLNQEALNTYYPFISDAPTSTFDIPTSYKYLVGIKDVFHQSIIITKDVDIESDLYRDLMNQKGVANIYTLSSEIYSNSDSPALHEVSTKVEQIKRV